MITQLILMNLYFNEISKIRSLNTLPITWLLTIFELSNKVPFWIYQYHFSRHQTSINKIKSLEFHWLLCTNALIAFLDFKINSDSYKQRFLDDSLHDVRDICTWWSMNSYSSSLGNRWDYVYCYFYSHVNRKLNAIFWISIIMLYITSK